MKKPIIAIDLDGTILDEDIDEFFRTNGKFFGKPKPFVRQALKEFQDLGYHITIFTARLNKSSEQINKNGYAETYESIGRILLKYAIPFNSIYEGNGKPFANIFIDDRAVRFTNWIDTAEEAKIALGEVRDVLKR